jgi:DNA uptake protein ComE-like DNA-binding protein
VTGVRVEAARRRAAAAALALATALLGAALPPDPPGPGALSSRPVNPGGAAALLYGCPLDPNRATAADLELVPGIGPARAQAIVRARHFAPFRDLEDVDRRVHGIGPAGVASLRRHLRVSPPEGCSP